jgi:MscS family membrane protein
MTLKLQSWYRGLLLILAVAVLWSLVASGQSTNVAVERANSAQLHESFQERMTGLDKHLLTFGLDRIPFLREETFLSEPLWKYLASLIYIFLAFYVAKLIDLVLFAWLRRLAKRTETKFDDLLLELLHGPIKVLTLVIFLHVGLTLFDWSAVAARYLSRSLVVIVAISLTYLILKIVDLALDFWRTRHAHENDPRFNEQLFSVIRKSLKVFMVVVATLVTASNIGINITAAITSLSIGGLAVGLAAQDTLANLFGAVAIFADKPFRVGDTIKVDSSEGVVESIGMRSTRIRNADGYLIAIPNKTMGNAAITNISGRSNIRTTLNFSLPQNLPTEKVNRALAILKEVYTNNPGTKDATITFNQFDGGKLIVAVVYHWKGTEQQKFVAAIQQMNLEVKQRFDAEGITLA